MKIRNSIGENLQCKVYIHENKNVDVIMEPVGRKIARWIENEADIRDAMNSSRSILVEDRFENKVFLFENEFATRWFLDKFPEIKLYSLL